MIHVMDASALLALARGEPGYEVVEDIIQTEQSVVSSVNMAEVGAKLIDSGLPQMQLARILQQFQVDVVDFNIEQAVRSACLRPLTKSFGLSLGDRACLGLAQLMDGCVVTADRAWNDVEALLQLKVIQIR